MSGCTTSEVVEVDPVVIDVEEVVEVEVDVVGDETDARPITTPTPAATRAPAVRISPRCRFLFMWSLFVGLEPNLCPAKPVVFSGLKGV